MSVELKLVADKLTAYLSGDIDHHTAAAMRTEIDHALRTNNIKILFEYGIICYASFNRVISVT